MEDLVVLFEKKQFDQLKTQVTDPQGSFLEAIKANQLKLVQWLYQEYPTIDIRADDDYAFRLACENDHLKVAQWLKSICRNINIKVMYDCIFKRACRNNQVEMAEWLKSRCSDYHLIIQNNQIVKWRVRHRCGFSYGSNPIKETL